MISSTPDRFATTYHDVMADPVFAERARPIGVPPALDRLPRRRFRPLDELRLFAAVLWAAFTAPALLLFSSRGYLKPELLAILCLTLLPRSLRPAIVLYGEMWEPSSGWGRHLERAILRLADRAIDRYIVFSSAECAVFAATWGVSPAKIRFCPFFISPRPSLHQDPAQGSCGGHVFAGGNSFRDYAPLLAAARRMPETRFYIGTARLAGRTDLPPNVCAAWFPRDEWDHLVSTAAVVVIPLRAGLHRTAGLLTLLEAMWSRRPLIVSDALGVRDYVTDGATGIVVDGTAEGYERALRDALSPQGRLVMPLLGEAAHLAVRERFTREAHCARVLSVIDEVLLLRAAPRPGAEPSRMFEAGELGRARPVPGPAPDVEVRGCEASQARPAPGRATMPD